MPDNIFMWAQFEGGFRAIASEDDLQPGETLVTGEPPVIFSVNNELTRSALRAGADNAIALLKDAVDLGMATDDETQRYNAWRKYRVLLSRMDIALESPKWPDVPSA